MAKKSTAKDVPCSPVTDLKYQAEDDVRTLERAEEIKADPARMKRAAASAGEKAAAMNKVVGDLSKRGLISDKAASKIKGKQTDE